MKLSRRNFLLSTGAAAALTPRFSPAQTVATQPKHLVVVLADGGWDVTFCHDPKFHVDLVDGPEVDETGVGDDVEEIKSYGDMQIVVNESKRRHVTTFFDNWWAQTAVVNGLWMGSIAHQSCRLRLLTGTSSSTNPDVSSIVGAMKGNDRPLGSIDLSGLGFAGQLASSSGRIGRRSQIKALLDPESRFQAPRGADYTLPLFDPDEGELAAVRQYLETRAGGFRAARGMGLHNVQAVDSFLESLDRRERLLAEAGPLIDGLELGTAPTLDLQAELTADMLDNELCHAVTLQHYFNWDTHEDNSAQHERYNSFFASLDHLMWQLSDRGLLENTLVAVVSEMTRTPRQNAAGGKDHWAHTSCMLLGAGVAGGRTYGATNDNIEALPVDLDTGDVDEANGALLKYDTLIAGLLERLDVDPGDWLPGVSPFRGAFV